MPFLPPNQQRQSTEGKNTEGKNLALLVVLIVCCRMFCYAGMFDLAALDLVFICNG